MNAIPADILALFSEIGPSTLCIEGVAFLEEDQAWAVSIDDHDAAVLIEWIADSAGLAFTTTLGRPEQDHRARIHGVLLQYNAFWRDTGGVRTALSRDGEELLMMREAPAHAMTLDPLRQTLLEFSATAQAWRRFVANPIAHEPPAFPGIVQAQAHMLRV